MKNDMIGPVHLLEKNKKQKEEQVLKFSQDDCHNMDKNVCD